MPISKGEPWGVELDAAPTDTVTCADDAALAAAVWSARNKATPGVGGSAPLFRIEDGDTLRTIGGPGSGRLALSMDVCQVMLGNRPDPIPMVAHVIARRRWWRGDAAAVMNAAWLGEWYLGPKAHPNDGLVDVTSGSLGVRDRFEAKRRAPAGGHLPHPNLRVERRSEWSHTFESPLEVFIDGVSHGRHPAISVLVHADAFTLVN